MKVTINVSILIIVLFLKVFTCFSQSSSGLPFIHNFPPSIYGHGTQNFCVIQDKQGVLYFGNNNGVLIFDGHTWNLIQVKNKSEVHSLEQDNNGRIYVGAQGEFGFLEEDPATGDLKYFLLSDKLPVDARNFNDVWNIYATGKEVIFRSTAGLYIYRDEKFKTIKFGSSTHRSFYIYNELFIREENFGLRKMVNDSLVMIPQGDKFLHEPIHSMFPYPGNKYLIVTQHEGIFIYDGNIIEPFNSPVNDLIKGQNIYGQLLPDTTYALGTRAKGLVIIDRNGKILYHLTKEQGLINESVWSVCADRSTGNLWVATNNGISFIEIQSPFSGFQKNIGPEGQIYHLQKFKDKIYAASTFGVYYKKINGEGSAAFSQIPNFNVQSWHFYSDSTSILVATNEGVFDLTNGKPQLVGDVNSRCWFLLPLKKHKGRILVNSANGFLILNKVKGKWIIERNIPRFFESLYYFVEDEAGNVWADSPIKGMYKIQFDENLENQLGYTLYNSKRGLPTDYKIMGFNYGNEVRFSTVKGIYKYSTENDTIIFDTDLNRKLFGDRKPSIAWIEEDAAKNFWFIIKEESEKNYSEAGGYAEFDINNGKYTTNTNIFWRIHDVKLRDFLYLNKEQTLIGSSDGIFSFNRTKIKANNFPVIVRKIILMKQDSSIAVPVNRSLNLPYKFNSVRFEFAGMNFSGNPHEYQCLLEGFDFQWQPWTTSSSKEYTQLPAGSYVFHLRAKNHYNEISDELKLEFTIIAPWYATAVAYTAYLFAGIALIYLIMQWRSHSLIIKNLKLEKVVTERTAEIQKQHDDIVNKNLLLESQKEEIESQKDYIEKKNQELEKAKDTIALQNLELLSINNNLENAVHERTLELQIAYQNLLATKNELDTFIYRSSHDIKGPLLRLLGLVNIAQLEVKDDTGLYYFKMLEKEIRLTNRILQKLIVFYYVKNADPQMHAVNLKQIVEKVIHAFNNEDGFNDVYFNLDETLNQNFECDHYLLEVALRNIIENAIVYRAKEKSQVEIALQPDGDFYHLTIQDNGTGIKEEVASRIFDMFYRGSEESPGAGLGLYITREALRKINGDIKYVKNEKTTFIITLPIALKPELVCRY